MPVLPVAGLCEPATGDIIGLDPGALCGLELDALLELMQRCGLCTADIHDRAAATTRLVERSAITPKD